MTTFSMNLLRVAAISALAGVGLATLIVNLRRRIKIHAHLYCDTDYNARVMLFDYDTLLTQTHVHGVGQSLYGREHVIISGESWHWGIDAKCEYKVKILHDCANKSAVGYDFNTKTMMWDEVDAELHWFFYLNYYNWIPPYGPISQDAKIDDD